MGNLFAKVQHIARDYCWISIMADFNSQSTELQCLAERAKGHIFGIVVHGNAPAKRYDVALLHNYSAQTCTLAGFPVGLVRETTRSELLKDNGLWKATGMSQEQVKEKLERIKKLRDGAKVAYTPYLLVPMEPPIKWVKTGNCKQWSATGQFAYDSPTIEQFINFYKHFGKRSSQFPPNSMSLFVADVLKNIDMNTPATPAKVHPGKPPIESLETLSYGDLGSASESSEKLLKKGKKGAKGQRQNSKGVSYKTF